jgi:serine/threonine-protein kinase
VRPGEELRVDGGRFERLIVVRELARPTEAGPTYPPAFVAHAYGPEGAELVVVERYRNLSPPSRDALLADVKRTASLRFPNLAQVQEASKSGPDVLVSTAYVEGELLGSLRALATASGRPLSLDVQVRVVVDVLAALSTIHTDKGPAGVTPPPPALVHGAVAPHTIVVGFDGVTRLLRPYMGRLLALNLDGAVAGYAAPEQLRTGKGSPRADVFAVGVLLWETLAQARLYEKTTREGRLAKATVPIPKLTLDGDRAWAAPLIPIVEKALATDPLARYGTAAEMAAAVRLAVRAKLAMPARVAELVDRHAGERILARRGELALPAPSGGERRSVRPSVPDGAARVLEKMRPSSRPPTPTPAAVAPIVVPKAPPVPIVAKPRPPNPGPRPAIGPVELTPPPASVDEAEVLEIESVREPPVAAAPLPPPVLPANLADEVLGAPVAEATAVAATAPAAPPEPAPPPPPAPPIRTPAPISAPTLPTPGAVAVPADDVPAGVPSKQRRWAPLLLLLLPVLGVILFFALRDTGGAATQPSSTASTGRPPPTSTIAATATTTAATTTTDSTATTTASAPSATATASDTASAATSDPTTTPTGNPTTRPSGSSHVRPKPTYDPEGI